MKALLIAGTVSLLVSLLGTPLFIRLLVRKQYGQFIRQDGPTTHLTKRGTPTMGGVIIIGATLTGWVVALTVTRTIPTVSALLALFLMVGLGFVGFLDDYIKISRQRSLGLSPLAKIIGQGVVGITFAVLALHFPNEQHRTPADTHISFIRDTKFNLAYFGVGIGVILFVVWANFLITAWSNAVNLTDGLDGLATGVSLVVFAAFVLVGVWQSNQTCQDVATVATATRRCYETRDPMSMAMVAIAITGALFGFLWWNTSPAQIFMGDTGSLALGGALAGLSILTRVELLAAIIGGLFVLEVLSDVIQIGWFKATRRRVFKMAPLHHHFELSGWGEVTIVVRFWIIAGLFVAAGIGVFYGEWVLS
ncbi:MAG: phospho-N-acetylmuramoyl-pentapeptide-transferase [Micrococcales bacterium]|nr:phospho-N-acetylmuramoyl-pentapeptide-transferase [Micrococcales bacterium]